MADEKKPTNPVLYVLLGRWLGHPLHPAVVHLPIAMWVGALFFDVLNWCNVWTEGGATNKGAYYLLLTGLISLAVVVPAGIAEWTQIKRERPAWKLALIHAVLNVAASGMFLASLLMRGRPSHIVEGQVPTAPFALCVVGVMVLMVSGFIGGRLVYEHGVAVARMSKKKWRSIATAGGANLPPAK